MLISKQQLFSTFLIAGFTALAAASGLLIPDLYRDSSALIPILRGQDLVTLLVAPLLIFTAFDAYSGSKRSLLVYIGLLGYILYTYTGAAFAYSFNKLILVYITLFSLSVFTLIAVLVEIDAEQIRQRFDANIPRKAIIVFLLMMALALALGEISQIIPFFVSGELPQAMQQIETNTYFVYVLDLGLIMPLSVIAAIWLWRDKAWGYVLATVMLIKAATMGLALLSMTWFSIQAGLATDGLVPLWSAIAVGGLGLSIWMLSHCDASPTVVSVYIER